MSRRGWALFVAMSVIWGIPYLLIKVADGGVSVPVLVCIRVALGSLLLAPAAIRGGHMRALRGHIKWLAAGRPGSGGSAASGGRFAVGDQGEWPCSGRCPARPAPGPA